MPPLNICLLAVCIVLLVVIIILITRIGNCQRDSFTAKEMQANTQVLAQMKANSAADIMRAQLKAATNFTKRPAFPWKFGDGMNDKGMFKRCEAKYGVGKCEKIGAIVYPKK